MGVELNCQQNIDHPYVKAVVEFNALAGYRAIRIYLRLDFMWKLLGYDKKFKSVIKVLNDFTNKVIKERSAIRENEKGKVDASTKPRINFLDMMLDLKDSDKLDEQHLREEVGMFNSLYLL